MGTRQRMHWLVWVIALSLGFYGVKGGIFALLTGGQHRVWGPAGSFIEDNNSLGLALIMTLPLLRFLQMHAQAAWLRLGLVGMMVLTVAATLSTQSRGAFIGLVAMGAMLWLKGRNKLVVGLALVVLAPAAYFMMPASWHQRMQTIETYDQDSSALGRINAWRFTVQLANHRLTGGGFRGIELESAYRTYAPQLYDEIMSKPNGAIRAAHSIWFGMLGQHGWVGLGLFVVLGLMAWRNGSWVIAHTKGRPDLAWYNDLARMLQVSLLGYAASGTFLSMEYFDFYYHLLALLVLAQFVLRRELAAEGAGVEAGSEVTPKVQPPPPAISPIGLQVRASGFSNADPPRRG
jgi:probable O-glycosylation ligase (exosortase A-associated)